MTSGGADRSGTPPQGTDLGSSGGRGTDCQAASWLLPERRRPTPIELPAERHPAEPEDPPALFDRFDRQEPGPVTPPVPGPACRDLDVQLPRPTRLHVARRMASRKERFPFPVPRPKLLNGSLASRLHVQPL